MSTLEERFDDADHRAIRTENEYSEAKDGVVRALHFLADTIDDSEPMHHVATGKPGHAANARLAMHSVMWALANLGLDRLVEAGEVADDAALLLTALQAEVDAAEDAAVNS